MSEHFTGYHKNTVPRRFVPAKPKPSNRQSELEADRVEALVNPEKFEIRIKPRGRRDVERFL